MASDDDNSSRRVNRDSDKRLKKRFVQPEDTRDPGTRPGAPDRGTGKQKLQSNLLNQGGNGRDPEARSYRGEGATGRNQDFTKPTPPKLAGFIASRNDDGDKIDGEARDKIGGSVRKIGGTASDKIGGIVKRIGGTAADKIDGVVKKKASEARRRKIAEYGE